MPIEMLKLLIILSVSLWCQGFHVGRVSSWRLRRKDPLQARDRIPCLLATSNDRVDDKEEGRNEGNLVQRREAIAENFREKSIESIQKDLVLWGQRYATRTGESSEEVDTDPTIVTSSRTKVPGCIANVHIQSVVDSQSRCIIRLEGTADALVSRGLLAVWARFCEGLTIDDLLAIDPNQLATDLGLRPALSVGRNDGLASLTRTTQQQVQNIFTGESSSVAKNSRQSSVAGEEGESTAPTVALLLSGGVDSSVALNILVRQGYNVTAFYLKIWLEDEVAHLGTCPWEDDYKECQAVTEQIGVPLEAISLQKEYQQRVITYTIQDAEQGRTPNPDIMCNSRIKFGCFYDAIASRDFDYVATGHYAQLTTDDATGRRVLQRAPDPVKDQTYFLCALNQEQLKRVLFPIGHLQKSEVRALAEEYDLPNRHRPDSQGLCFLGKVKFDDFLGAYLGSRPGPILDAANGDWLGQHQGVWYHTVGQRKGIGKVLDPLATSRGPWYVVAKDPSKDVVYCSNQYDQEMFDAPRSEVTVENLHWIANVPPVATLLEDDDRYGIRLDMKIRHGPRLVNGLVTWALDDPTVADIRLDHKDGGLAPGQFVVLYSDDVCLGGGVISEKHWTKFLTATKEDSVPASGPQ